MQGNNLPAVRNSLSDLQSVVYGKIPPQARDLEEAVLGAVLISTDVIGAIVDQLMPQIFYDDRHRLICEAIMSLYRANRPIDILTVTEELRSLGVIEGAGGAYYVTSLTNKVGSTAHVDEHIKIVWQKYISRQIIAISSAGVHDAYEDTTDVFELLQSMEKSFYELTNRKLKESVSIASVIASNIKIATTVKENPTKSIGAASGLRELDAVTSGWQKQDLIIIAARPSMGKSALVTTIAANAAIDHSIGVAVFSLEMSTEQVGNRVLSMRSEVDHESIKRGYLTDYDLERMNRVSQEMNGVNLFIDDTPALNVYDLRAKARRLKMKYDIGLIIVDYLQLMTVSQKKGQNREGEVSEISRTLKAIAKELNIPVIALSQLSRKVEERGGSKKPMLSDLRESGAIEQDADVVMFIHRPEYYGIETDENGNSTKGVAELIIAKHRNGSLATVKTSFIGKYTKFCDYTGDSPATERTSYSRYVPKDKKDDFPF